MIKRKLVTISMQPEDEELLNSIAAEVGLNRSELIRRMIYKISFDEKMRAIIKRGKVITLNNVHSVNEEKKSDNTKEKQRAGDQPGSDSSSLESTEIIQDIHYKEARRNTLQRIADILTACATKYQLANNDEKPHWEKCLKFWTNVQKVKREMMQ